MRYLVTAEEMRRYDAYTIEQIGIPGMVLMERAALASKDLILDFCCNNKEICAPATALIMVGTGNNGGDGLALARLLTEQGFLVEIWCVGDTAKGSKQWQLQYQILQKYEVVFSDHPTSKEYTVIVDALFGVGLSREITGVYFDAINDFNRLMGVKLALDVPSGVCSDTGAILGCAVQVDHTISFGYAKRGLYLYPGCERAGKVEIADIGISDRSFAGKKPEMFCLKNAEEWLPKRMHMGNKGTFGKVLVIAGSKGMAGAAILCAKAAFRVGAGMVKVLTDEGNRVIVQESIPEAMYGTRDDLRESLAWADIVVIGPGIGRDEAAYCCLEQVITQSDKPLLIDADALYLLAHNNALLRKLVACAERGIIMTPHVGEFGGLTGITVSDLKIALWQHAKEVAIKWNVILVAKDARSFVCTADQPICMNILGNNGMATAGSGDVLAGMIAGLWAQYKEQDDAKHSAFLAACAGVYIHAASGDAVARDKGEASLMAGDLVEAVSEVIKSNRP